MSDRKYIESLKIHHIGYLVKNLTKSLSLFSAFGYRVTKDRVYDAIRGINICFMEKDGYMIELVEPVEKDSVVSNLRKKIGNGPYHICYEVGNLAEAVKELEEDHFVVWEKAEVAPALDDRRVIFLLHAQMGLIELLEI